MSFRLRRVSGGRVARLLRWVSIGYIVVREIIIQIPITHLSQIIISMITMFDPLAVDHALAIPDD